MNPKVIETLGRIFGFCYLVSAALLVCWEKTALIGVGMFAVAFIIGHGGVRSTIKHLTSSPIEEEDKN